MNRIVESSARHRRTWKSFVGALAQKQNYSGIYRILTQCRRPITFIRRYVGNSGHYPAQITVSTPIGPISITTYSPDDIQTVNEIFFRRDYGSGTEDKVIVDFGSNIGVSALYFLSRNQDAFVYGHEPLRQNIERFEQNLAPFTGRYEVAPIAVGLGDGEVDFGYEATGRYGGVGRTDTGQSIKVPSRDSNLILQKVLDRHGRIDVLKVDIETLEEAVVTRIPDTIVTKISTIIVEYPFSKNPFPETHRMERYRNVTTFTALHRDN